MRKLLSLIVLVIAAVLGAVHFSTSLLLSEETTQQDSRPAPEFSGISTWLNSPPLTLEALRGKGRAGAVLDLLLHQLCAHVALRHEMARDVQGQRPRRGRRAYA